MPSIRRILFWTNQVESPLLIVESYNQWYFKRFCDCAYEWILNLYKHLKCEVLIILLVSYGYEDKFTQVF